MMYMMLIYFPVLPIIQKFSETSKTLTIVSVNSLRNRRELICIRISNAANSDGAFYFWLWHGNLISDIKYFKIQINSIYLSRVSRSYRDDLKIRIKVLAIARIAACIARVSIENRDKELSPLNFRLYTI